MKKKPVLYIYRDKANAYRWQLTVGKRVVADSGECYASKSNALRAARRLAAIAIDAELVRQ